MKLYCIFIIILLQTTLLGHDKTMSIHKLEEYIKKGIIVVDIRTEKEWIKTGIIPGSYKITYFDENNKSNQKRWIYILSRLVKNKDGHFILISNKDKRSKKVANILIKDIGYKNVFYLEGGINAWIYAKNKVLNY